MDDTHSDIGANDVSDIGANHVLDAALTCGGAR